MHTYLIKYYVDNSANTTEETVSIHWYAKSWMDKKTIIRSKLTKPIHRLLGTEFFKKRK